MGYDYDWVAIEREWSTGQYASVRALALSLQTDNRFGGNAPTHAGISKRVSVDLEKWEAAAEERRGPKPWQKRLAGQIEERAKEKLLTIGLPDFGNLSEAEQVEKAAEQIATLRQSHRGHAMRLRRQCWQITLLVEEKLTKIQEAYKSYGRLDMEELDQLTALQERMARAVDRLIAVEMRTFGMEEPSQGAGSGAQGSGDSEDDVLKRARAVGSGAAELVAFIRTRSSDGAAQEGGTVP